MALITELVRAIAVVGGPAQDAAASAVHQEANQATEYEVPSGRYPFQLAQSVSWREPVAPPSKLLESDARPLLVEESSRVPVHVVSPEVFGPQAQPRAAHEVWVGEHHVCLGVIEERVGVEIGRADSEPAVVHDPHLRMYVGAWAVDCHLLQGDCHSR